MNDLIGVLALWLSLVFGLPSAHEHPKIRHLPIADLAVIRYGSRQAAMGHDVAALYDAQTQTIFLTDDWDRRDHTDVSILVHELVHHLQHVAGLEYRCPAAREKLAYEAQARWLAPYGMSLRGAFGIDALTLKVRTSCMGP